MDVEAELLFEFRRLELVAKGRLAEDDVAYVYKDAEAMGLVCDDDHRGVFSIKRDGGFAARMD